MAAVDLNSVTKRWGTTAAVDDISFTVEQGHLCAILGPSGCGKSTTLRLVAGLESTTNGVIRIAGKDVTGLPPAARGISMVFQSYALFPHLNVRENIVFGLKVRSVAAPEREARLAEAADILGLGDLLDRRPSQLSGGQQQRVALGRAIVARTPVCLMDEPLSNLDAQLRIEMRREIRDLQKRLGITMLYVTHDQTEAMTMADQVVLMRDGKIEQNGSPDDLYDNPATTFVARFVGTPPMNILPAAALEAFIAVPGDVPPGTLLGLRPEAISLVPEGVPAEVVAAEYLGAESLIEARLDGHPVIIRRPGKVRAVRGEVIGLSWNFDDALWFDAGSGRRVPRRGQSL